MKRRQLLLEIILNLDFEVYLVSIRGVAQPGSASALGAEGRRLKSCRPDKNFKT